MNTILILVQILLSISLIALIFLQSSGSAEGRGNFFSNVSFEKRGWEKFMFNLTITIFVLFIISSLVQTLL
jgi:protein translocase SecG subunit